MKKLFSLLKLDFLLAARSSLYWSLLITAIIAIVFIDFVIPAKLDIMPEALFYDGTSNKILEQYLETGGVNKKYIISNKEGLINLVKKGKSQIGVIFEGSLTKPKFTLVYDDSISESSVNLVKASINKFAQVLKGDFQDKGFDIKSLRNKSDTIPLNKNTIPMFMVFEVMVLGFMLSSIMIFQEKQEGTILAYRVSPAGTLSYIISKSLLFLFSSLIYGAIIIVFTMGIAVNFVLLLLIIALGSLLMTLLGLFVGIFFDDISGWFPWGVLILVVDMIPVISYINPAFSPLWIRVIPAYSIMLSMREILFPTGKAGFIMPVLIMLSIECIVMFAISFWGVKNKLMKAGGHYV